MKNVKYEAETLIIQRCISVKLRAAVHFLAYLSYNTNPRAFFFSPLPVFFMLTSIEIESLGKKSSSCFFLRPSVTFRSVSPN